MHPSGQASTGTCGTRGSSPFNLPPDPFGTSVCSAADLSVPPYVPLYLCTSVPLYLRTSVPLYLRTSVPPYLRHKHPQLGAFSHLPTPPPPLPRIQRTQRTQRPHPVPKRDELTAHCCVKHHPSCIHLKPDISSSRCHFFLCVCGGCFASVSPFRGFRPPLQMRPQLACPVTWHDFQGLSHQGNYPDLLARTAMETANGMSLTPPPSGYRDC